MHYYPAASCPVSVSADEYGLPGGVLVAVRARDLVSPLKSGAPLEETDRSATAVAGTQRIGTGEPVVFCKVVVVAPAQVTRDGQVRAQGSPCEHARLGPLEEWLEDKAGPSVIGRIAQHAPLDGKYVKDDRKRLLAAAFVIRALLLMTLSGDGGIADAAADLAGDLALVPWASPWHVPSERSLRDWLWALGPEPLEDLQAEVLGGAWAEHQDEDRDLDLTVGTWTSPSGPAAGCGSGPGTGPCSGCRTRRRTGPRSGPSAPAMAPLPGPASGPSRSAAC